MKALELHWHKQDEYGWYTHPVHGFLFNDNDIEYTAEYKRLTYAELAAEYWRAVATGRWLPEAQVLNRFATTPHVEWEFEE